MKKILCMALIMTLLLAGCSPQGVSPAQDYSYGEDWLLNTLCYIKIFEAGREDIIKDSFALARSLEGELSKTMEASAVSKINRAEADTGINLDDSEFTTAGVVLANALSFMEYSDGLFDPCIGAVSNLWDFTSGAGKLPADSDIKNALLYVGEGMISIADDENVYKAYDEVQIDFGAIAKGYIAQQVAFFLKDNGITCAILSFGGNIVLIGEKYDGNEWQIGIESPSLDHNGERLEERDAVGYIYLAGNTGETVSIVTSGTYERYIKDGEKIYHHILDPRTGYSADTDLSSATIIGPDSMCCDAIATIAILKGSGQAEEFINKYNKETESNYQYVLITNDGEIIKSQDISFLQ